MMLTEQSVARTLSEVIAHLQDGRTQEAATLLSDLYFDRIAGPVKHDGKTAFDPAANFGRDRVLTTGKLIRACQRNIQRGWVEVALANAVAALERWTKGKGE